MRYDIKRDGVTLIEHEVKGKRIKSAPAVDYKVELSQNKLFKIK